MRESGTEPLLLGDASDLQNLQASKFVWSLGFLQYEHVFDPGTSWNNFIWRKDCRVQAAGRSTASRHAMLWQATLAL